MFKLDDNYFKKAKTYTKKDAYIALLVYFMMLLIYVIVGFIYNKYLINLDFLVNIIFLVLIFIIVKKRKQNLSTVGITKKNFLKSFLLGLSLGLIILLLNTISNTIVNLKELKYILSLSIYYFIIVGFSEEVIFRGFIQTRMYALIKNEVLCIAVVGILFMIMHIPFRYFAGDNSFSVFISHYYLPVAMTFMWHFAFNYLYMRYNSVVAPTIFHGFMNISNKLFY